MSLISSSLPNFANGVSQQPYTLRLSSQGEVQENGYSTVAKGLRKRPPKKHLKQLSTTSFGDAFTHIINRDNTEQYVVVITNGNLRVFDVLGNEKTVNFPNGKAYLSAATPSSNFRAVTVADYTFIVNRTVKVQEDTALTTNPVRPPEALLYVKQGNYGKTYSVTVNNEPAVSYTTANGGTSSDVTTINTDTIASSLAGGLAAKTTSTTLNGDPVMAALYAIKTGGSSNVGYTTVTTPFGFTTYRAGSVVYITSSKDFNISCDDGFNNYAMNVIKVTTQKFSDLPARCPVDGFVTCISGEQGSKTDRYFVRYSATLGATGVWRECGCPGMSNGLLDTSMPHVLVREADGSFTFKPAPWADRKAGDTITNPHPSFMGRKINDVFFYRNRLGFLADENMVMSEAGEFFNLYRTTVMQLLDSDPIDVTASNTKVSILEHALQFNKQLLLFSEQAQFLVDQGDVLSPSSVSLKLTTEFPCNTKTKPVGIGRSVYFTVDKGSWAAVQEYYTDAYNAGLQDAQEVTGHVPKYIPAGTFKIAVSLNENTACFLTNGDKSSLFIYKYLWANSEKLQSSWSKWTFGTGTQILNAEFVQSILILLIQRNDGVYLETIDLALGSQDSYELYQTLLDRRRVIPASSLTYTNGRTYFTDPVTTGTGEQIMAVTAVGGTKNAGIIMEVKKDANGSYVEKNVTGCDLIVGAKYTFKYTLSTIVVKQQTGTAQKSDTEGRLQIRKVAFNYSDTGYFKVKVTPANRQTYEYVYTGKVLGGVSSTLGTIVLDTGRFSAQVMTRNVDADITVENDSPVPCALLSADWEGFYVKRSQPI